MNVDRLLRVRDEIEADPESLEMIDDFVTPRFNGHGAFVGCNLCIAARAAIDAGMISLRDTPRPGAPGTFYDVKVPGSEQVFLLQLGAMALELDPRQADRLFFVDDWPRNFRESFSKAPSAKARAVVTTRRIGRFIDSEGME